MMNYETFKEIVAEQFVRYMPDDFENHKVKIYPVKKVNQTYDGLNLIPPDGMQETISPTIYVNEMYQDYLEDGNLQYTLELAAFKMAGLYRTIPDIGNISLDDAEKRVVMMLVNTEQNSDMLKEMPHREYEDLSIIYRYVAAKEKSGIQSVIVTDRLAEAFGMTEQQLFEAAVVNTKKLFPPEVKSMNEVLCEIYVGKGMPEEMAQIMFRPMPEDKVMYIITNDCRINGAVSMLYETELHKLAEEIDDDLYILPSSVHEVIAVPASDHNPNELAEMVSEINMSEVPLKERLSNQVYHYDKDLRRLSLATDTPNKRLDGIVSEPPLVYEAKQSR